MGLAELLLLAVGLAMDAFAVFLGASKNAKYRITDCAELCASAAGSEHFSF